MPWSSRRASSLASPVGELGGSARRRLISVLASREERGTTTDKVYRNHFTERRRESLRRRLEAREKAVGEGAMETQVETTDGTGPHKTMPQEGAIPFEARHSD